MKINIDQNKIDWLREKRPAYDASMKKWYFQCAYADASDTYWTLPEYLFNVVRSSDYDASCLRAYYSSPANVLRKMHQWLDQKQTYLDALEV